MDIRETRKVKPNWSFLTAYVSPRKCSAHQSDIDPLPARELNFKTQDNRVAPLFETSCAFRVTGKE